MEEIDSFENNVPSEKPMECSDIDEDSEKIDAPPEVRICLVGGAATDESIQEAAKTFGVPVETSSDGTEWMDSPEYSTVFVLEEFSGRIFDNLKERGHRILGPTALKELALDKSPLPDNVRPQYSLAMKGVVACFTGFRKKEEMGHLLVLVHHMGGSIRKDVCSKTTHLIANCVGGDKYQYASLFRLPIMSADWVHNSWAMRTQVGYSAVNCSAGDRLKPFHGARVCFLGFPEEERKHMADILIENGGTPTDIEDPACSHVVLDCLETYDMYRKELIHAAKRRRCDSHVSPPPPLDCSLLQCPSSCSTPKSHLSASAISTGVPMLETETTEVTDVCEVMTVETDVSLSKMIADHNDDCLANQSKRCRTESPKREKGAFKTPTRLNIVRRSLRLKTTNVLTKWISSLDVSLGSRHDSTSQPSEPPIPECTTHTEMKEDCGMSKLVVDESTTNSAPNELRSKANVVKAEWFWSSVQNEACVSEKDHQFQESVGRLTPRVSIGSTPGSIRGRKRKRLRTAAARMLGGSGPLTPTSPPLEPLKRRSSITDSSLLSCSGGSFLDATTHNELEETEAECTESPKKNLSARHLVFLEFLQTESNYVEILKTIMTLFKAPLEEMLDGEDQLLNATELRIIFGNLPPIYHAHCKMLESLRQAYQTWTEEVSVGQIFLQYASDFEKAYPPFVNFFDTVRDEIKKCDSCKPRFHAFLKARQTRPECGRQPLSELLIRPVQRLPSIGLLLSDILKHTNKNNPDHSALEKALAAIREVMTHINEDKRKTEGQMALFDIFNVIVGCPPHLVSSHRTFIEKCEVMELSEGLSGRGDHLVLFLFSDVIEVCKKRSKVFNSIKSPNSTVSSKPTNQGKPYKHIKLMPLATIRKVIDIKETDDCHNVFALMCRSTQDLKEKLYSFTITDEEVDKLNWIRTLCRHTANNAYRADCDSFMATIDASLLDIETSDVGLGTLGKAFKFATRTRIKVGRALSFNKTPSKLKRAMSTMMSPFGSTTNLTPATQLAQMRLASCTNINMTPENSFFESESSLSNQENDITVLRELANASPPPPQYVAPMSVQPTRRSKHSSLSVASLRRL